MPVEVVHASDRAPCKERHIWNRNTARSADIKGFKLSQSFLTAFFFALLSIGHVQAQVTYYIHVHLGSPIAAEDQDGNLLWREQYAPYGNTQLNQNRQDDPVGFTGKQRYDDLGLSYFGARWYDSSIGRFLTPDPAGWQASNPYFSFNQYAYGHNNPLSIIDPDGREALDIVRAAFNVAMSASFSGPVYEPLVQFGLINVPSVDYVDSRHGALAEAGWMIGAAIATKGRVKGKHFVNSRGTETVQRAMSRAELTAIQNSGVLSRGGRPGPHYVSDAVNSTANRARQRLALPQTPEVRVTMEVPTGMFSKPSKIEPYANMPGGGMERTAPGNLDIPATIRRIDNL